MSLLQEAAAAISDPSSANWLFSACAQTAGAIVAIVGGFLVSSLIGLRSRFDSLTQQLYGCDKQIEAALENLQEAERDRKKWEQEEFLFSALFRILASGCNLTASDLVQEFETRSLRLEDLTDPVKRTIEDARNAMEVMRTSNLQLVHQNTPFKLFRSQKGSRVPQDAGLVWEAAYNYMMRARHTETVDESVVTCIRSDEQTGHWYNTYAELCENGRVAQSHVAEADLRRVGIITQLLSLGLPRDSFPVLALLMFMAVGGIMIPLALLPFGSGWGGPWKWIVLTLFYSGLVFLFAWLWGRTRSLRKSIQRVKDQAASGVL